MPLTSCRENCACPPGTGCERLRFNPQTRVPRLPEKCAVHGEVWGGHLQTRASFPARVPPLPPFCSGGVPVGENEQWGVTILTSRRRLVRSSDRLLLRKRSPFYGEKGSGLFSSNASTWLTSVRSSCTCSRSSVNVRWRSDSGSGGDVVALDLRAPFYEVGEIVSDYSGFCGLRASSTATVACRQLPSLHQPGRCKPQ